MADRMLWTMTVWLCVSTTLVGAPRQPAQVPKTDKPAPDAAVPEAPTERKISAEEAVRLATDALDRWEAREGGDTLETILEQVDRYIEIVETSDPTNPHVPYLSGRVYALTGRRGDAVDQLRKFVNTREGRNEWRAYAILGDLFGEEFPRLAKSNYVKAAALKPGEPRVLLGLSSCAFKLGANEDAIRLAREAIAADGGRTGSYHSHLAALLHAARRWNDALREAEVALSLAQETMRERVGARPPLLAVEAQYTTLIGILQARIAEPQHQRVDDYLRLASYLRERAEIAGLLALHDVARVLEIGVDRTLPDTPPGMLEQLGIALTEVGRTEAAIAVFEKVLEIDPDNAVVPQWFNRLRPEATDSSPTTNP